MFLILANEICDDYVLASILTIVRRFLDLIQMVVPIILLVAGVWQFVKLMLNPDDDKKGKKKLVNSFMSAIIVFFIPVVINLTMDLVTEYGDVGIGTSGTIVSLNISSCWTSVREKQDIMDSVRDSGGSLSSTISKEASKNKALLGSNNYTNSGGISGGDSSSGANTTAGSSVIEYAKKFLGYPYVYGGNSLTKGTDCSGFIHLIYKNFNINVPRASTSLRTVGTAVSDISQARAGDIICYNGHVALFMGDGMKIIHASNERDGIKISPNAKYRDIVAIRRVTN